MTQFFVLIQDTNLNLVYVPHYLPSQHVPYSTKQVQNARCTMLQFGETFYRITLKISKVKDDFKQLSALGGIKQLCEPNFTQF